MAINKAVFFIVSACFLVFPGFYNWVSANSSSCSTSRDCGGATPYCCTDKKCYSNCSGPLRCVTDNDCANGSVCCGEECHSSCAKRTCATRGDCGGVYSDCCNFSCRKSCAGITCPVPVDETCDGAYPYCCANRCVAKKCRDKPCDSKKDCGKEFPYCCGGNCSTVCLDVLCKSDGDCDGSETVCCGGHCKSTCSHVACLLDKNCGGLHPRCCKSRCRSTCSSSTSVWSFWFISRPNQFWLPIVTFVFGNILVYKEV